MMFLNQYDLLICAAFLVSIALLCLLASVGQCWLERCRRGETSFNLLSL